MGHIICRRPLPPPPPPLSLPNIMQELVVAVLQPAAWREWTMRQGEPYNLVRQPWCPIRQWVPPAAVVTSASWCAGAMLCNAGYRVSLFY